MKKMTYGQWLRQARRERGLTQRDIETRAGVGENALSKIENDVRRPSVETRTEIHRVLRTSEKDLAELGILEEIGASGRYDWPPSRPARPGEGSAVVSRSEAMSQIREAAGDMQWTQDMVDTIVSQIRLLRSLQSKG